MTRWTGIAVPSLLYSALHQVGGGFDEHERKTIEFHRGLRHGMEMWSVEASARLEDEARRLAGELGVGSEGEKIVEDWVRTLVDPDISIHSWEVRSVVVAEPPPGAAALIDRASARVAEWGLDPDRPVAESLFVFDGSDRLDIVESLVRDRLGIYRPPHGPMMAGLTSTRFSLANRIGAAGSDAEWDDGWWEAHLNFSKGKMRYDEFRERLGSGVAALAGISPWVGAYQRKLGLGPMREFSVRFACGPESLQEAIEALASADEYIAGVVERSALLVSVRTPV